MKYHKNRHRKKTEQKKKSKTGMGLFIAFIMISSVFAILFYGFGETTQVDRYDGHTFRWTNEGYTVSLKGTTYAFDLLPQHVEMAHVTQEASTLLKSAQAVITTSEQNSPYATDIAIASYNLNTLLGKDGIFVSNAFIDSQTPITCADATPGNPVIYFQEALIASQITASDNCITIMFENPASLQQMVTKLLYMYLGIIQ